MSPWRQFFAPPQTLPLLHQTFLPRTPTTLAYLRCLILFRSLDVLRRTDRSSLHKKQTSGCSDPVGTSDAGLGGGGTVWMSPRAGAGMSRSTGGCTVGAAAGRCSSGLGVDGRLADCGEPEPERLRSRLTGADVAVGGTDSTGPLGVVILPSMALLPCASSASSPEAMA